MTRLAILALTLLLAAPANAQIGRLIDRARQTATDAVRAAPTQATGAARTTAAGAAERATAGVVLAGTPIEQPHAPAANWLTMLGSRFYEQRGEIGFDRVAMLFPRSTEPQGTFEVRRADGTLVGSQAIGTATLSSDRVFADLGTRSRPTYSGPTTDGAYTYDLVVDGQLIGRIPFTVRTLAPADAFSGGTRYRRVDGPWRTLGYLAHQVDPDRRPDLIATVWLSPAELGGRTTRVVAELRRGGTLVATSRETDVFPTEDWSPRDLNLIKPTSTASATHTFTLRDMEAGAYTLTVRAVGGAALRTFPLTGLAGGIAPHPRSALDHQPRHDFLTPRSAGLAIYWLETP